MPALSAGFSLAACLREVLGGADQELRAEADALRPYIEQVAGWLHGCMAGCMADQLG